MKIKKRGILVKKILFILMCVLSLMFLFGCGSDRTRIPDSDLIKYDIPKGFVGEYEAESIDDSTFLLYLKKDNVFELVDIGAGNPVLKGHLYRENAYDSDIFVIDCAEDEDFDKHNPLGFLNDQNICGIEFLKNQTTKEKTVVLYFNNKQFHFVKVK